MRAFLFFSMLTVITISSNVVAGITFYTSRTDWENAVNSPIAVEDFDSVVPYTMVEGMNQGGLISIELLNLYHSGDWNSISDGSAPLNINGTPHYQAGSSQTGARQIHLHLPLVTTAFGGDFVSTHSNGGLTLNVLGIDYEFTSLLPGGDGSGFLGFVATDTFLSVTLYDASKNETFGLDTVSFAVPEPATIVLLGLGGFVLRKCKPVL